MGEVWRLRLKSGLSMLAMEQVRVMPTASDFAGESVSPSLTVCGYAAVGYCTAGSAAVGVIHLVSS